MKQPVSAEQRQQIFELRRQYSLSEVAKRTGLPLGTVKTVVSRSGRFRDNPTHRALFSLPPIRISAQTMPAKIELPPQQVVTGDHEIDAVLWLRAVINTGQADLIEKAIQAKTRIKTPLKEIEKRCTKHLVSTNPGNFVAALGSIGFADLDELAEKAVRRERMRGEAFARFGDAIFSETDAESFCVDALHGLKPEGDFQMLNTAMVAAKFKACIEFMPNTILDCLHELKFWGDLYSLRTAIDSHSADSGPEAYARDWFVFGLLAEIRPRNQAEAILVFRYLSASERMNQEETEAILTNLIGR